MTPTNLKGLSVADGKARKIDQLGGSIASVNTPGESHGQHHRITAGRDLRIAGYRAKQRAVFDHLCTNGKLFTGIKRPKGFRQMRRKDCFRNSQSLAIDGRATYVEGLCVGSLGIAFAHGWLTLDGEHAIDVTLPDAESYAYFGIAFDAVALAHAICKSGYFGSHLGLASTMPMPRQLAEAKQAKVPTEARDLGDVDHRRVAQ